jgi:hypothetical protein
MKYFSYALTTDEFTMTDICPDAVRYGSSTLHGYELRFAETADIIPNVKSQVEGILWDIPEEYIDMITAVERHEHKKQILVSYGKETTRAWTSQREIYTRPNVPSWEYWEQIEDAYSQQGLPVLQIVDAIDQIEKYYDTGFKL